MNTRNFCILAHVDHGKTTLSDSLIASNGIISQKLSGKIRYMDSRDDEQQRGITMKSSSIQLRFGILSRGTQGETVTNNYDINLIDSPGHVDFSSEVSTASRLSDGALVLVDAVEGVCTQTITVLRQAWVERIKPILVLNKIDRLITELQLAPLDAFLHLKKILEQVNAIMATFFSEDLMEDDAKNFEKATQQLNQKNKFNETNTDADIEQLQANMQDWQLEDKDDSHIYFSPEAGNVLFASAIDGWAFRLDHFARVYAEKLQIKPQLLQKVLWGEYYLDTKAKRVVGPKGLKGRPLKPMFVQFVLENIWAVYDAVLMNLDREKIEKIVKTLNLKILPRDLKSKDIRALLQSVMGQWLPLSSATLLAVVQQLPSPAEAQKLRFPKLLAELEEHYEEIINDDNGDEKTAANGDTLQAASTAMVPDSIKDALIDCDASEDRHVIGYISKMISVLKKDLPENKRQKLTADQMREMRRIKLMAAQLQAEENALKKDGDEIQEQGEQQQQKEDAMKKQENQEEQVMIGFARLYSGSLKPGMEVYILGPKYNPAKPDAHVTKVKVSSLYKFMGRDLMSLDKVEAGFIFGIGGLEEVVLKSATLSTTKECPNLGMVQTTGSPIVRVAVEPKDPTQMNKLKEGLRLLNQADPCVEVYLQETGEHVIATAGELHLERCLKDLKETFAKIELSVSPPLVPFRETISKSKGLMNPQESTLFNFSLSVASKNNNEDKRQDENKEDQDNYEAPSKYEAETEESLPTGTVEVMTPNKQCSFSLRCIPIPNSLVNWLCAQSQKIRHLNMLKKTSNDNTESIAEYEKFASSLLDVCESQTFKEESQGIEGVDWKYLIEKLWAFGPKRVGPNMLVVSAFEDPATESIRKQFESSIHAGFQLATSSGPLCAEPMQGVCFFFSQFHVEQQEDSLKAASLAGQVISSLRDACRLAFLQWSPRLMLSLYSCDLQTPSDVLGKVYSVLSRRKGRILSEEMKEGTPFFMIKSLLPVVESFGFSDDIRKRTSGAASPQLVFHGYELLDIDPFWIPNTEEELEDLGEKADRENVAKKYLESVRKRKGMVVEKKIIEHAEKQRTLKSK